MIFGFVILFYTVRSIYLKILSDKYLKESRKLQLLINNLKKEYGELIEEPTDFIGGALGSMGIEGLLKQFGVDESILKNPVVRGIIDRYAPKLMESLNKGGGGGENKTKSESQV